MRETVEGTTFHVATEREPASTVIGGFSQFGLAGLTAVDFLVDHLELEQTGHLSAEGLPTITPFENGRPRHPTRLFSRDDLDVTLLVGELFVPNSLAEPFSRAVLDWTERANVDEIAVLSGAPFPHEPTEHHTFYVASDDYRAMHFPESDPDDDRGEAAAPDTAGATDATDTTHATDTTDSVDPGTVRPMANGFLDGTNAALLARSMESDLRGCVYVTPVHPQTPDVDAAIRLVEAVEEVYGLDVDTGPLEAFASQVGDYYRSLADRLEEQAEEEQPSDRMYM
ncbi:proteasome assembly chaperone family protein [Halobaculum sp. WSA2]|uniref:Proteasome assembly chaperone family protein n=1 Tax=Halobaculum saliterrae TaxID=2073113 RepID=A0A6B0T7Z6_9EURY|nr:PAC2 family protein [Halobaculum saliterrae]MXR42629.1 proteasome assembly chaperone family protein [Halobaculum saliterrae]